MRKLLKYLFLKSLYIFYSLLVKTVTKDKKTFPKRYVYDLYEIFPSIDRAGFDMKIGLPYIKVDNFNRHDLNRPYEVLQVDLVKNQIIKNIPLSLTCDFVLPIALLDKSGADKASKSVKLTYGDKKATLQLLFKNRFHYIPVRTDFDIKKVSIQSDHELLVVAPPIYRNSDLSNTQSKLKTNKPKLIVHIFVDALSKVLIDSCKTDVMPATKSFFSDGVTFENAYSQSDWTLSSISGVFTGKYTKDHLIYHPRRGDKIKETTLAEILNGEGYLTSLISAVPRLTPINGFDKGFSRCVIAPHKDANYIINEAVEQLNAFDGNQYLFLGLFDVHEANTLQPLSSQVKNLTSDFHYKTIIPSKTLSVLYDKERFAMCANTLTHLDSKLETLYAKIKDYDENAVVVLHSDHGVDFITQNTQRLSREREKVVFMIRGGNLSKACAESIREIREIPSMMLNASNSEETMHYEISEFVKTESIYPNQDYELAIRDTQYVLFFQVPWNDLKDRVRSGYEFKASLHNVHDESEIVESSLSYNVMLRAAKDHYVELINNLIAFESG